MRGEGDPGPQGHHLTVCWGCGCPLLCSQALLQEAGMQHLPRHIPAAQGTGRPAGSLPCSTPSQGGDGERN